MISLHRILKLRDLEIFHVSRNGRIISYVVIEDTRNPFTEEDSDLITSFFSDFVNNTNLTNFIIKEYIQEDLYDHEVNLKFFNKMLKNIGSNYSIEEFDEINWIYLSQD
ncbi:terpene synthase [Priestia aryabhattai]|uniref:terpene synthase n=1 Tax=Priestia aryabhattai TaxID=412384 RepID=UPI0025A45454|nr:terpene synthase [Priestia aryabhattai]WJN43540.1 terpene synthase [Priestia aryabhattai]